MTNRRSNRFSDGQSSSTEMAVTEPDIAELCHLGIETLKDIVGPEIDHIGTFFDEMMTRVKVR